MTQKLQKKCKFKSSYRQRLEHSADIKIFFDLKQIDVSLKKQEAHENSSLCVSCDLKPFRFIPGVTQVLGDVTEKNTIDQIKRNLTGNIAFDLVISGFEDNYDKKHLFLEQYVS